MRAYSGISASRHKDADVRHDFMRLDEFLRDLDGAIGRLSGGLQANSSGSSISPPALTDFFFLPGRSGGQTGFGGTTNNTSLRLYGQTVNIGAAGAGTLRMLFQGEPDGAHNNAQLLLWAADSTGNTYMSYGDEPQSNLDSLTLTTATSAHSWFVDALGHTYIGSRPNAFANTGHLNVRGDVLFAGSDFGGSYAPIAKFPSGIISGLTVQAAGFRIGSTFGSGIYPFFLRAGGVAGTDTGRMGFFPSTGNFGTETFRISTGFNMTLSGLTNADTWTQAQGNILMLDFATVNVTGALTLIGLTTLDHLTIDNATASDVLLKLIPHPSQSADIWQIRDSSNAVNVVAVSAGGGVTIAPTADVPPLQITALPTGISDTLVFTGPAGLIDFTIQAAGEHNIRTPLVVWPAGVGNSPSITVNYGTPSSDSVFSVPSVTTGTFGIRVGAVSDIVNRTASVGLTNLVTTPNSTTGVGTYTVTCYVLCMVAGAAGSNVTVSVGWTDNNGARTQQISSTLLEATTQFGTGFLNIRNASGNITWSTTYTDTGAGTPAYRVWLRAALL